MQFTVVDAMPAATVLVPLDAPSGRGRGAGQLAARHLRARAAVRRRHAAADDRDRLPRDGLGEARSLEEQYHEHVTGWDFFLPRLAAVRAPRCGMRTAMSVTVDDDLWSAIGDPTRRRMLDLLLADGGGTATSLSEQLPVTRQAVAKHLGVLDRVGLVHGTAAGRERRYRVDERPARPRGRPTVVGRRRPGTPVCSASSASPRRSSARRHDAHDEHQPTQQEARESKDRWWTSCTGSASRRPRRSRCTTH